MKKLFNTYIAFITLMFISSFVTADTLSTDLTVTKVGFPGIYFNVTAKSNDVYVSGFDLYMRTSGNVTVYYKVGSYVGSETNAAAWTTLGTRNIVAGDSLASIPLGGVTIPAGTTYGFYFFTDGTLRYNDSGVDDTDFSNNDIAIFASGSSGGFFASANNTRVWSGSVHYSVKGLSTTFANNQVSRGNYVNITAKGRDINISGFDVNFQGAGPVTVYYKKGSYKGSETTPSDWLFLSQRSITGVAGNATELSIGGLVVPAGETYAFIFNTTVPNGMRHTESLRIFIPPNFISLNEDYSNNDLAIFTDTAIGNILYTDTIDNRVWNGRVHYTLPKAIKTLNASTTSASGNFFDVTAQDRNVHISSFDLNFNGTDELVRAYYRKGSYKGNENLSDGWVSIGAAFITGTAGILTELPIGGVTIPDGETYGFLLHSPGCGFCMQYTSNGSAGNFRNDELSIFTDSARSGNSPFSGLLNSPRIWNGRIYYTAKDGSSCYVSRASNGNAFTFCL